jgi:TRAP-type mannitol/chloroaromatic compound transport system substrate-binding protein
MNTLIPEGLSWQAEHMIDRIETMSGGRMEIDLFTGGELMDPEEAHHALSEGTFEMARDSPAYCADVVDLAYVVFGLPRAWDGPMALWTIFIRMGMLELAREAWAEYNINYLAVTAEPPYAMIMKEPIRSLDEMSGVKMRAYGLTAEYLDSLGAKTTYIPGPEIYTAFATGTIDAAVYGGASDYLGMSLGEVTSYYLHDPYMVNPNTDYIGVNMDAWNALPDDLKEIIQVAAWERVLWVGTDFYLGEYKYISDMGLESIRWSAEDKAAMNAAAVPFWDAEAEKSPRVAEAVQVCLDWLAMQ